MALLLLLLASVAGSASDAWTRNAPPCSAARWPNSAHGNSTWPEGAYVQSSRWVPGGKCASRS
eukprot:1881309-Alexandrium_andersonii.AAC.1